MLPMRYLALFNLEHRHIVYFVTAVITYGCAAILSNILRYLLDRYFRRTSIASRLDPTRYTFTKNAVSLIIYILATVFVFQTIPSLRTLGLTLFASAGIFAAIVGIASQTAIASVVSGIFIVIFKPFRVDDIVVVNKEYEGVVEDITMRHTVIRNYENRRIVIPNTVISNAIIINSTITDERICLHVNLNISYDSDIDKALKILQTTAENHPLCLDNRTAADKTKGLPKVKVALVSLDDSSVQIRAWVWAHDPSSGFELKCALLKQVKAAFDEAEITIPFPTRTIIEKVSAETKKTVDDGSRAQQEK